MSKFLTVEYLQQLKDERVVMRGALGIFAKKIVDDPVQKVYDVAAHQLLDDTRILDAKIEYLENYLHG